MLYHQISELFILDLKEVFTMMNWKSVTYALQLILFLTSGDQNELKEMLKGI